MNALGIVVRFEAVQFALQIGSVPEQDVIQELTSDSPDDPLDERVRERHVGNRFDLFNLEDTKVRLPRVIGEERVIIGAQVLGDTLLSNGVVEHAA